MKRWMPFGDVQHTDFKIPSSADGVSTAKSVNLTPKRLSDTTNVKPALINMEEVVKKVHFFVLKNDDGIRLSSRVHKMSKSL